MTSRQNPERVLRAVTLDEPAHTPIAFGLEKDQSENLVGSKNPVIISMIS